MYNYGKPTKTTLIVNKSYIGERIEEKVNRVVNNREPIKDSAPQIFQERNEGVHPAYNIRTDTWELATESMDKVTADALAKREARHNPLKAVKKEEGKEAGGQSTDGTDSGTGSTK